jgi:fatty-acyl-CoA synthase
MYQVKLSESYFPAQPGKTLLDSSIGAELSRAAADSGERVALVEMLESGELNRQWTYSELYEAALKLACHLSFKYDKGTRIAVCAHNIPEWIILEYASALAGLVLVTVNPSFQTSEVRYVIEQSGSVALYIVDEVRGNPVAKIAKQVQAETPCLEDIVDMRDELAFFGEQRLAVEGLPEVAPQDPVQIQYTSGTTGFPKGVVLHHHGILNNAVLLSERLRVDENDTYLNMMPMFHTAGCGMGALCPLVSRGRLVLAALFNPTTINAILESEDISYFLAVPTMLVGLLEDLAKTPRTHHVKAIMSGASMVAPTLVEAAEHQWQCAVQVVYGQTETSPVITQTWHDDTPEDLSRTVGQPYPWTEISIIDNETGNYTAVDQVGEICARGYCLMHEYNDNPEATAATIDANGWLHTGDLGAMDERGYVKVTGRLKEMIIRGGENLFPVEIENAMLNHPSLAEIAVVGVPDDKWGEQACCFIRLEEGADALSAEQLKDYVRTILSPQKTPNYWVYVSEWPLTASGKIQKFKLREQFEQGLHAPV